jgi:hypothetical protein
LRRKLEALCILAIWNKARTLSRPRFGFPLCALSADIPENMAFGRKGHRDEDGKAGSRNFALA